MVNRRQFLKAGVALAATAALPSAASAFVPSSAQRLTILHTNDVHSHLEPPTSGKYAGFGGVEARSSFIKLARMKHRNVLLLDAGDMFQGTPYYNIFGGEAELRAMSAQGYDAGTIGNHEFDSGVDKLAEVVKKHAAFPLLNCNYDFTNTSMKGLTRESLVLDRDGLRIGLLGLGIKLDGLVSARLVGDVRYNDPIANASRVAKMLRNDEKCDFIIALSHINILSRTEATNGEPGDRDLIREVPEIDLVLGGHNHYLLDRPEGFYRGGDNRMGYVAQTGWAGTHMGFLQFDLYGRGAKELVMSRPVLMDGMG
ncbi:bifunctional metallophosphatase/5'-nucleotidase [bacterium]|nr:bifunctional metallophosphatase/5'-nucleotidase [bacterium]